MNRSARSLRRAFYSKTRRVSLEDLPKYTGKFINDNWQTPLLDSERLIEQKLVKYHEGGTLYHGGTAGLCVGDTLLPSSATGISTNSTHDASFRKVMVYATPGLSKARDYAARCSGQVYKVELVGKLGVDFLEVRALSLILNSPQFKKVSLGVGKVYAERAAIKMVPVSLTGESATILEVCP